MHFFLHFNVNIYFIIPLIENKKIILFIHIIIIKMLNYLRVTIRKVKVINDNDFHSFNLRIELFKQIQEIEKLRSSENELNRVLIY